MGGYGIENIRIDGYQNYFRTDDGVSDPVIEISWREIQVIRHIVLKENIKLSQRIEKFIIEAYGDGEYRIVYEGTVIGYKRIVLLEEIKTDRIRIRILDARVAPTLSFIGVY